MKGDPVKLAEEYRVSLGLRSWPAQEEYARSKGHYPRRSGRTARGLLDAIARCVAYDIPVLHIAQTGVNACTSYCASMARDLVAKLQLDIRVEVERTRPDSLPSSPSRYFDHFGPAMPATVRTFQPVTVSADAIARAKDDPKLVDALRKQHDAAIARLLDLAAHPRVFVRDVDVKITGGTAIGTIQYKGAAPEPVWQREYLGEWVDPPKVSDDLYRQRDEMVRRARESFGLAPAALDPKPVDPLDAVVDGRTLRWCLAIDESSRRLENHGFTLSPAQRAAVSAHWSADLRARIAAAKAKERNVVTYCEVDADE